MEVIIKVLKTQLLDVDIQTQNSDIHDMDDLKTYKLLKLNFGEDYMFCVINRISRTAFSTFRGGLPKLECYDGRCNNPFNERICPLCKNDIEIKYHFLLVCPNLSQIRSKYISFIWCTYPSINKFIQLYTSNNKGIITNISRYIFTAMKFRKHNSSTA